jgi:hypothetical protein
MLVIHPPFFRVAQLLRDQNRDLHMMLAMKCTDDIMESISIESVSRLWKAKGMFQLALNSSPV